MAPSRGRAMFYTKTSIVSWVTHPCRRTSCNWDNMIGELSISLMINSTWSQICTMGLRSWFCGICFQDEVRQPYLYLEYCESVIADNIWCQCLEAKFMGPTWGPPGSSRPQMGPMLAPWTLLSGSGCYESRESNVMYGYPEHFRDCSVASIVYVHWNYMLTIYCWRL